MLTRNLVKKNYLDFVSTLTEDQIELPTVLGAVRQEFTYNHFINI